MTAREIWKLGYRAGRVRGQITGKERYIERLVSPAAMTSQTMVRTLLMPNATTTPMSMLFVHPPRTRSLWQRLTRRHA